MELRQDKLLLSATDLSYHVGCCHLTQQNLHVARGELNRPVWRDIRVDGLRQRGFAHEAAFIAHLEATRGSQRNEIKTTKATPIRSNRLER